MGIRAVHFSDLEEEIGRAEIIFNTVPNLILDRVMLERVSREVVIIDLASIPGGTDFEYAEMWYKGSISSRSAWDCGSQKCRKNTFKYISSAYSPIC